MKNYTKEEIIFNCFWFDENFSIFQIYKRFKESFENKQEVSKIIEEMTKKGFLKYISGGIHRPTDSGEKFLFINEFKLE